ncbi:Aste57867_11403 [Aphanomyces stellatus]|uniref:Aste57867_11403 protein n=1 Tax=Aphanomyces stellatus TaxID=120398 RepID=A0A485KU13_9STRA|nr:hypothetical protein As57867_011361 [Aphanomyces stellatus]VFT88264.1 Aste57867_11403 [Aphanomyces stellatus]
MVHQRTPPSSPRRGSGIDMNLAYTAQPPTDTLLSTSERLPRLHPLGDAMPSLLSPRTAGQKKRYMHNWENIFGRHTHSFSPRGLLLLVQKEGKPVLFLMLLGALVSLLDYAINEAIVALRAVHGALLAWLTTQASDDSIVWGYTLLGSVVWGVLFALFSIFWTHFVDPMAAGSGIPEIKTILSADQRHAPGRYLRSRTLVAKSIGLVTAQASGLSVGKEGPFVHTAAIICHQLMKHCAFFHRIYRNESLHRHMYNAACAVGVASTFGAPIGGVLFSIEVTSSYFLLSNYWKSFVAAVSGAIVKQILDYCTKQSQQRLHSFQALFPTTYNDASFGQLELIPFACLGFGMGILGATYVTCAARCRAFFGPRNQKYPLVWGSLVSMVVTLIVFCPGPFSRLSVADTLHALTSPDALGPMWQWGGAVYGPLAVDAVAKIVITLLSVSLPIPSGDFIPLFTAGAALGRLLGEALAWVYPTANIVPGGYALVGGASLVAASTHTISVAVIALELTGQFIYFTPLFLAVLIAGGIGNALSLSVYDSVIVSKGLPYLPMLRCHEMRMALVCARDVMEDHLSFLPNATTRGDIRALLLRFKRSSIPVVQDSTTRLFCGCVAREDLEEKFLDGDNHDDNAPVCLSEMVEMSGNVIKVDEETPLETVHLLFEMLKCAKLFVTKFGVLVGVVTRASIHNRLTYLAPGAVSAAQVIADADPILRRDDDVC